MQRKPNTVCPVCKEPCYKRPSDLELGRTYCSRKCYGISTRVTKPCTICGTEIINATKRITCSKACAAKNRTGINYRKSGTGPVRKTERLRYDLVNALGAEVCQRCGYNEYPAILQVHHVIERAKGGSDDLSNLELICPNCHMAEHHCRRIASPYEQKYRQVD